MSEHTESAGESDPGLSISGQPVPATSAHTVVARRGDVVVLPPERIGNDKPGRRHALVTDVTPALCGTAVYGSTSARPQRWGAPYVSIWPRWIPSRNGFTKRTFLYTAHLACAYDDEIERRLGALRGGELAAVQRSLKKAIGYASGSARIWPGGRSWRGRIVELTPDFVQDGDFEYALVLTEHAYSEKQYYQVVVPIVLPDPNEDGPLDVPLTLPELARLLGGELDSVVCLTPYVFSVFHRFEIARDTGFIASEAEIGAIEVVLARRLGCPLADA